MATRVDQVPKAMRREKYPWDQWADGSAWLLVRGEDYQVETSAMRRAVYAYANRTGARARTMLSPDQRSLYIQIVKREPKKVLKLKKK